MKVTLAKDSGFCFGVKNTLTKLHELEGKSNAYILGNLIHNPQVVENLAKKGFKTVHSIDEVEKGTIVISAHGVPEKTIKLAEDKGLNVLDTTCPIVKSLHNIVKKLEKTGYEVIIFGDENHTEVKGIRGHVKSAYVVKDMHKLSEIINNQKKYGIVFQTTQDTDKFKKIKELFANDENIVIKDTICNATKSRQESAKELAKNVDMMVVIGGYNSANTKRLAEICSRIVETKQIEIKEELKKEWFENREYIGVTAGASTPGWIINNVIEKIKNEF